MKDYHDLEKKYNDLSDSRDFVEEVLKAKNDEHKAISQAERKVIFYPPKLITQSEVDAATKHIIQENEESAEEFYNHKKSDYEL